MGFWGFGVLGRFLYHDHVQCALGSDDDDDIVGPCYHVWPAGGRADLAAERVRKVCGCDAQRHDTAELETEGAIKESWETRCWEE